MRGPWEGDWPVTAGWRYSSGNGHFAYDIGCPMKTKLFAAGDGKVLDCHDGEKDFATPRYSGMPSNWIILQWTASRGPYKGKTLTTYYQHLHSVAVKQGQRVKEGELIGLSGSTGNSTGPHLHITTVKPGHTMTEGTRYAYMANTSMVVWPPERAWGGNRAVDGRITVHLGKLRPGVDDSLSVRFLRRCLINRGLLKVQKPLSVKRPGNKYTDAVAEAVKVWQRRHGYTPDGTLNRKQAEEFFARNSKVRLV